MNIFFNMKKDGILVIKGNLFSSELSKVPYDFSGDVTIEGNLYMDRRLDVKY